MKPLERLPSWVAPAVGVVKADAWVCGYAEFRLAQTGADGVCFVFFVRSCGLEVREGLSAVVHDSLCISRAYRSWTIWEEREWWRRGDGGSGMVVKGGKVTSGIYIGMHMGYIYITIKGYEYTIRATVS